MDYEFIQIRSLRKYWLCLIAKKNRRSMLQQLDLLLKNAGVQDLSDRELNNALKQIEGEEILNVVRK